MKNSSILIMIIISLIIAVYLFIQKKEKIINDNVPAIEYSEENKGIEIYDGIFLKYENNNTISSENNYVIFTLEGNNNYDGILYYEITLKDMYSNNLYFNLYELSDNTIISKVENKEIFVDQINNLSVINKKYKIEIIDDNIDNKNIVPNINISTIKKKSGTEIKELGLTLIDKYKNNIWKDTDGIIYFSGDNESINFNYVWYSGKLWRITAINPDGTMKLITDNMMTTIAWGNNIEYNGSWVYQWLNEDFYDTLYNATSILVPNAEWNYTIDGNRIPLKPDTLPNQKTVSAPVGLISSYEYYNASRISQINYLSLNHRWWHITPQGERAVRSTDESGRQDLNNRHPGNYERGIRPMIYLKSDVEVNGLGTKNDPYRIIGDISDAKQNDYLNTRISGEYVIFDNDVYRIIDIIDNKAKIMRVDYLRDGRKGIEKHIARTIVFGKSTHPQNNEWWDYYLINTWFPTISSNYQSMVVDGTYYLGEYSDYTHYKNTICQDSDLDHVLVKSCTKYTAIDKVYTGKVGLSRIGEMFAAQQLDYEKEPLEMWTITPFDFQENRIIHETNSLWRHKTWGGYHVVHPTLYLKEGIKISSGNGTFNSPYQIYE